MKAPNPRQSHLHARGMSGEKRKAVLTVVPEEQPAKRSHKVQTWATEAVRDEMGFKAIQHSLNCRHPRWHGMQWARSALERELGVAVAWERGRPLQMLMYTKS